MRFQFIDAQNASMPVARLCAFTGVSSSGYYAWKERPASARQRADIVLLAHIKERFEAPNRAYGARRVAAGLAGTDMPVDEHRVARLMRDKILKI